MLVFVCSPYGGKRENFKRAQEYCALEMALGNTPFAPHVHYHGILSEDVDRETGIQHGLEVLSRCDELHRWTKQITDGMRREIEYAESVGIPVRVMV